MTAPETLLELAERCEKATGPDFSLDCDIARVMWAGWERGVAPATTASLDAAMSLVPEGAGLVTLMVGLPGDGALSNRAVISGRHGARAATPALALCAAALKARAQAKDSK